MKFSGVLREAIEEDNGLVLRLAAFETMLASDPDKRERFGRRLRNLIERVKQRITNQARKLFEGSAQSAPTKEGVEHVTHQRTI